MTTYSLTSMTGFGRADGSLAAGTGAPWAWAWELRSVNARGLDVRMRLPNGLDRLEAEARKRIAAGLGRGSVTANLSLRRESAAAPVRINRALIDQIMTLQSELEADGVIFPSPPRLDVLLSVRGVVETEEEAEPDAEARGVLDAALLTGLEQAAAALTAARADEGRQLAEVLAGQVDAMEALRTEAAALAATQPAHLRERLAAQLATLLGASPPVSEERLAQELALLATKADIREELDRRAAPLDAARTLMAADGPVGRRLDFLCQELNREANTLCSKSTDIELTRCGLALKSTIEQFREQVQNVE